MILRYGFIISKYVKRYTQWELVENAKKCLAVVAAIFVAQRGVGQASMMIVVISAITVMQTKLEPFNEDEASGGSPGCNLLQWRLLMLENSHLVVELLFELGLLGEDLTTVALSATTLIGFVLILPELFESVDKAIQGARDTVSQKCKAVAVQLGLTQPADEVVPVMTAVAPAGAAHRYNKSSAKLHARSCGG